MKKVLLLITLLLLYGLYGCGSGGSSNVTQAQPPTTVEPGAPTGSVVVHIIDGDAKTSADDDWKTAAVVPTATNVRLVISNSTIRINGLAYKQIVDGLIPAGGQINGLKFPVASGYTFELITYVPDHVQPGNTVPVNRMLKYAKQTT